jgi:hypothetical protein
MNSNKQTAVNRGSIAKDKDYKSGLFTRKKYQFAHNWLIGRFHLESIPANITTQVADCDASLMLG